MSEAEPFTVQLYQFLMGLSAAYFCQGVIHFDRRNYGKSIEKGDTSESPDIRVYRRRKKQRVSPHSPRPTYTRIVICASVDRSFVRRGKKNCRTWAADRKRSGNDRSVSVPTWTRSRIESESIPLIKSFLRRKRIHSPPPPHPKIYFKIKILFSRSRDQPKRSAGLTIVGTFYK